MKKKGIFILLVVICSHIKNYGQSDSVNTCVDSISEEVCDSLQNCFSSYLFPGNNGRFFSKFGPRWGRMHYGNDIKMGTGDSVRAVQRGVVVRSNWGTNFGRLIIVEHENQVQTYYAHLSKFIKKKGDKVKRGEAIGLAGRTGNARGPHLHFEMHEKGKAYDPELVYNYSSRKIRNEALQESSLAAIHKKMRPIGYANNIAVPEYYRVRKGDSLWKISRKYKISIKTICRLNHISERTILQIGQPLQLY